MELWSHDAFASAIAYAVLGNLDALLAAHPAGNDLRVALYMDRLPVIGDPGTGAMHEPSDEPLDAQAVQMTLQWLYVTITGALRHLTQRTDATAELTAVAALGVVAALQAVVGPPLLLAPAQMEEWTLWLETGPDIWTTDPSRIAARRALAQSLRQGRAVAHVRRTDPGARWISPDLIGR